MDWQTIGFCFALFVIAATFIRLFFPDDRTF